MKVESLESESPVSELEDLELNLEPGPSLPVSPGTFKSLFVHLPKGTGLTRSNRVQGCWPGGWSLNIPIVCDQRGKASVGKPDSFCYLKAQVTLVISTWQVFSSVGIGNCPLQT